MVGGEEALDGGAGAGGADDLAGAQLLAVGEADADGDAVLLASSMPIRDAESFMRGSDARVRLFSNRGANGIDGMVSTAAGIARGSSGATWVMEKNHPVPGVDPNSSASRDYAPGFMTDLMAKDLGLAVAAAREKRVPVAVAAAAQQLYRMASAHGLGRKDCASVYRFLAPSKDEAPV